MDDISTEELSSNGGYDVPPDVDRRSSVPPPLVPPISSDSNGDGGLTSESEAQDVGEGAADFAKNLEDFSFKFNLNLDGTPNNGTIKLTGPKLKSKQEVSKPVECDEDSDDAGEQWDFSLKKLKLLGPEYKTIWVSDKDFTKTLTKMNTFGECEHEPIKITCPCEKETKFNVCFKCHIVFCSAKCSKTNKSVKKIPECEARKVADEPSTETAISNDIDHDKSLASSLAVYGSSDDGETMAIGIKTVTAGPEAAHSIQPIKSVEVEAKQNEAVRIDSRNDLMTKTSPDVPVKVPTHSFPLGYRSPPYTNNPRGTGVIRGMQSQPHVNFPFNPQIGLLPAPGHYGNRPPLIMPPQPTVVGPRLMRAPQSLLGTPSEYNMPSITPPPQFNYHQFHPIGPNNINAGNSNRTRDQGKVERNPQPRTITASQECFRGDRRGTSNYNDNLGKSQSRCVTSEGNNDEDLRFHERHASNNASELGPQINGRREESVGQNAATQFNLAQRRCERTAWQERQRIGRRPVDYPETSSSRLPQKSNTPSGRDTLLRVIHDQNPKPQQELTATRFQIRNFDSEDLSLQQNEKAKNNSSNLQNSSADVSIRHVSKESHLITSPSKAYRSNTHVLPDASSLRKSKFHSPTKSPAKSNVLFRISQNPVVVFRLPMMVGHSFGDNIFEFYAFSSYGGSDIPKIEHAIKAIKNLSPLALIQKGAYCLAKYTDDDEGVDGWFRARVFDTSDDKISVYFIDYGNEEVINREFICELPTNLLEFYPAVMKLSISDFTPQQNPAARRVIANYFENYIKNEWIRVVILDEDKTPGTNGVVGFKAKLEIGNGNEVDMEWINLAAMLEKEGVGQQVSPGGLTNSFQPRYPCSETITLDESQRELPILISHVTHLNDFDVIEQQHIPSRNAIQKKLETASMVEYPITSWQRSEFLCAALMNNETWARAKISMIARQPNTVLVKFVDFGETALIPIQDLRALPPDMLHIPQLSFKCSLPVFPVAGRWPEEWITLLKTVANAGHEVQTAIHLFAKEMDPHLIYIVEVFSGTVKDGLAKSLLHRRFKDGCQCMYEVDLNVRRKV